ncbi:MAG: 3-methyl-2-oxobutanoate hydroxymethyltransferase, partial [Candidatus Omnitrophica bacterium]|nr:3-methyl-2-oxobutanoate hydroxymethyltransferase [Candidatus Omnitrophota bacterium]
ECVPFSLAEIITKDLNIPTIGIGAGVYCDGQVLVTNDILGLYDRHSPKFVKKYVDLSEAALKAITQFRDEVKSCKFPDIEHSYSMSIEEINRVREL